MATPDEPRVELEAWARERKLNALSATTQQLYAFRHQTVREYVSQFRKSSLNAVLPDEARLMSVEDALRGGRVNDINIRKLLTDNREKFRKG
jgi:hypothetical protein